MLLSLDAAYWREAPAHRATPCSSKLRNRGERYLVGFEALASRLFSSVADFITPIHATPSLDVAGNRRHMLGGDPERVQRFDTLRRLQTAGVASEKLKPSLRR